MLKTLVTVNWMVEADQLCARLEANGIKTFMPDQDTATASPMYANALGGVRIQVDESDFEAARELMRGRLPPVSTGIFQCPVCGSDAVHYEKFSTRYALLILFLFGIPLLWLKNQCSCKVCGHTWKPD